MARADVLGALVARARTHGALPAVLLLSGSGARQGVQQLRALGHFHPFDSLELGATEPPTIEAVRTLVAQVGTHPMFGERRLCILWDIDTYSPEAATTLLKILEEPPSLAHFVLVAHSAHAVLPTIRSRAQVIRLEEEEGSEAQRWYEEFGRVRTKPLAERLIFAHALAALPDSSRTVAAIGQKLIREGASERRYLVWGKKFLEVSPRLMTNANPILALEALMVELDDGSEHTVQEGMQ